VEHSSLRHPPCKAALQAQPGILLVLIVSSGWVIVQGLHSRGHAINIRVHAGQARS
jgi:hypothetical protein